MSRDSSNANEWILLAMEKYLDMVYRLAHARTHSGQDAEDIAQEVMLKLMTNADKIENEEHLKAWLIRVTVNQTHSFFRSAWRRWTAPMDAAALKGEVSQENDRLDGALETLSRKLRVVVHLYYYEEMSVEEIGQALGIRPNAVKMRLSRARRILRERLEERDG